MIRVWRFYKNLLLENRIWTRRISLWGLFWFFVGGILYVYRPDLFQLLLNFLKQALRDILSQQDQKLAFGTALLIFKNNLTVAALSLFLGIVFGLIPLVSVAINFFILGFLAAVFISHHQLVKFLALTVSHGIFELPGFILASAFGARLGLGGVRFVKTHMKYCLQVAPLLIILFFVAAFLEVFVSGKFALNLR